MKFLENSKIRHYCVIFLPYFWYLLFFFIPFLIILKISFTELAQKIPPYTDLFTYNSESASLQFIFKFNNYFFIFSDDLYWSSYINSVFIAAVGAFLTFCLGFPMALIISRCSQVVRNILMLIVIIPSWTSFLIRIYAWMGILSTDGYLNKMLMFFGIINEPLTLLYTQTAVYIGIVYAYLPFMVLPIYTILVKMDWSLVEAAYDLGAKPFTVFFKVILPLAKQGIIAGFMLVFIPSVGEFVIPDLLGSSDMKMIGRVLWNEFFNNRDWPLASAIAMLMLFILIVPIVIFNNQQTKQSAENT